MLLFEFVLRFRNGVEERREIIKCYTLHDHIEIVIVVQMLLKNMSKHSQHDRAERKHLVAKQQVDSRKIAANDFKMERRLKATNQRTKEGTEKK